MTSPSRSRPGRLAAATVALLGAALLAGCGTSVKLDGPAPVESRDTRTPAAEAASRSAGVGAGQAGVGSTGVTTVQAGSVGALGAAGASGAAVAGRVIYFDFDSYVIKEEFRPVIEAHGRRLINERQRQLLVEGHTDERGGREYNLALGQRRAEAVARALVLVGARDAQVEAVSLGEERPAATGSDEAAWAKNRRAELKDK
jgi:peptidoglycan-associated lipoprotein